MSWLKVEGIVQQYDTIEKAEAVAADLQQNDSRGDVIGRESTYGDDGRILSERGVLLLMAAITTITTERFLEFWSKVTDDLCVHPDDAAVLRDNRHRFETNTMVGPFMGKVKTAPVVFLTLNPGSSGVESDEAQTPSVREGTKRILGGDAPLPSFETNPEGRKWTQRILTQFGVRYESAVDRVAFINFVPYRSKGFTDHKLITRLHSVSMVRRWTEDTLFREARGGERIVVCIVAHERWGLQPGTTQGVSLFSPQCVPRQYILIHGPDREKIGQLIRRAVFNPHATASFSYQAREIA
jgi:hypothetical protein